MNNALLILSFTSGFGLGLLNYRMFVRAISAALSQGGGTGFRKRMLPGMVFRYLFVFIAGVCLIRGASFAPFPLCGGFLLAHYLCRYQAYRSQQKREGRV